MAIGWLTALKYIPWSQVVKKAPEIAEGARQLWGAVAKKPMPPTIEGTDLKANASPEAKAIAALEDKVSALVIAASDLQNQMIESSKLIKDLADQNTQLVRRYDSMRLWLVGILSIVGVVAITAFVMILTHRTP